MWPRTFSQRLAQWSDLRQEVQSLPLDQCLTEVNTWWFRTPWANFYLHWDDKHLWPDPWQLLHDNIYCSVARGLGIMYTLELLDRSDCRDARLIEMGADNIVVVDAGRYVLNYLPDQITDISVEIVNTPRCINQQYLKEKLC